MVYFSDDYIVPSGTELIIGMFNMQRNKDVWGPNADQFNPDHFQFESFKEKHSYSFIPFSAGPRNCIG